VRPSNFGLFLLGPVPMSWIARASALPGRALAVGIFVWFRRGIVGETTVKVNLSRIPGIDRYAAARGLAELEQAGLVSVVRARGRAPMVNIRTR
jgi:hypothetical protein